MTKDSGALSIDFIVGFTIFLNRIYLGSVAGPRVIDQFAGFYH